MLTPICHLTVGRFARREGRVEGRVRLRPRRRAEAVIPIAQVRRPAAREVRHPENLTLCRSKLTIIGRPRRSRIQKAPATPARTGERLFLANLETINQVIAFVCRRHHLTSADADDFASHARLKLIEDDYLVLAKFEGRSSLKTFLSITIQRMFFDYRTAAWGKWRPSAEARRGGSVAVLLEQLLTRDGYTFEEAYEIIRSNHGVEVSRDALEALAGRLPAKPRRRFEPSEALDDVPAATQADAGAIDEERQRSARRIADVLEAVLSEIQPQDRLILRFRFEDGRSVAEIAMLLRLEQKPLYRRLERLFRDLRRALEARGVGAEAVNDVIGDADVDLAAGSDSRETPASGPSIAKGADAWR